MTATFATPAPITAPERSLEQRMEALRNANRIRSYRAQVKRDLKAGRIKITDLLLEPVHEDLATAKVHDLLMATPKYGRVKANRLLQMMRVSPAKTVGGLTDRQRSELVALLLR